MSWTKMPPAILVIVEDSDEDFETVVETVVEAVQRSGMTAEVRRATTGEAGLALLRDLATNRQVIVFMDLNTPRTDGREALAEIKTDTALRSIPVVVFSTSANPKDIGYCYAVGANAYHVKPVRYPEHLQLVIDLFSYWFGRVALNTAEGSSS